MNQIRSQIVRKLIDRGFIPVQVNIEGMDLLYQSDSDIVFSIMILHLSQGNEIFTEQFNHLYRQAEQSFRARGYGKVSLFCIFLTDRMEYVRSIDANPESYWTIDVLQRKLIIYENQRRDYLGIRPMLEEALDLQAENNPVARRTPIVMKKAIKSYLSMINIVIVVINVVIFFISDFSGGEWENKGALSWYKVVEEKEVWRIITYMFLHGGISHILNNMLILFFLGNILEKILGKWKYLLVYFGSGIIAGWVSIGYNMYQYYNLNLMQAIFASSVGASGAIFGVVGAMVFIVLCNKGKIQNIGRNQMFLFVAFSLYGGFTSEGVDNAAHLGGLIAGFLIAALLFVITKIRKTKFAS